MGLNCLIKSTGLNNLLGVVIRWVAKPTEEILLSPSSLEASETSLESRQLPFSPSLGPPAQAQKPCLLCWESKPEADRWPPLVGMDSLGVYPPSEPSLLLFWPALFEPPGRGEAAERPNSPMSHKKGAVQDSSQATLEGLYVNLMYWCSQNIHPVWQSFPF